MGDQSPSSYLAPHLFTKAQSAKENQYMVNLHFHIHYLTSPGEQLFVDYHPQYKSSEQPQRIMLRTLDGGHWIGNISVDAETTYIYQYGIQQIQGDVMETKPARQIRIDTDAKNIYLFDFWRVRQNLNQIFLSAAFRDVILKRDLSTRDKLPTLPDNAKNHLSFMLLAPDVDPGLVVGVIGDSDFLGNWQHPVILSDHAFPVWKAHIPVDNMGGTVSYKYVLCDPESGEVKAWEDGGNRVLNYQFPGETGGRHCVTDEGFRHAAPWWRGAGVAMPVFSLRTKKSFGIGEFLDIITLSDVCAQAGMKMIQVLPVNDTIANKTWKDSYPYAAISVFALHPLYINLQDIAPFTKKSHAQKFNRDLKKLNALEQVDFNAVLELKMAYLRILYDQEREKVFSTRAFKKFVKDNKSWLLPYAVFCHLRDENGTPDFNQWRAHSTFSQRAINALAKKGSKTYEDVWFYIFLQYHADRQLKEAKSYAAEKGIVLKGDLPIGIYRYSCDAWMAPELYHMDEQAGAPPDDYSELGQNWGFPTYNWEEMAKDGFAWWKSRMHKLSEYFDALRIDHILGFFRIWQIPLDQVQGTMGMFNPRLAYHMHELYRFGVEGDLMRYSRPFIPEYVLYELFEDDVEYVVQNLLEGIGHGHYRLREFVNTQVKVRDFFNQEKNQSRKHLIRPLYQLISDVLLLEEPGSEASGFNPRITLNKTFSYQALSDHEKGIFDTLYVEYYYQRHDDFWRRQAMWKLPPIVNATDMLICGEDLGMIPAPVPGVMKELNIIPLEIQRMPKGNTRYGNPAAYDYLTVCSPSCHDMSTIRGWWEADHENAQLFYNTHLQIMGQAPQTCYSSLVEMINREHLNAPSILAIFPLQDLLGMDDQLKKEDPFAEQINEPSDPDHYWRYRLHIDLEDLNKETAFLHRVRQLVRDSGRIVE